MGFLNDGVVTKLVATLKQYFATKNDVELLSSDKQDKLISGTNIKKVNNTSLLGAGNISIPSPPTVTSSDNGKVLRVVNGAWAAAQLPSASGVNF